MHNTTTPCQYAIVRFAPFVETGEFANIGIILFAPKIGFFDFKVAHTKFSRVTSFFTEIKAPEYRKVVNNFTHELKRIRNIMMHGEHDGDLNKTIFRDVIKTREGIIQFSEARVVLATDPSAKINELYDFYIDRSFANVEQVEATLEKTVRAWFKNTPLANNFRKHKIGEGIHEISFPFVAMQDGKPVKIIKPFYLGHKNPRMILDHGHLWRGRFERLTGCLPDDILIAVRGPDEGTNDNIDCDRHEAFEEAVHNLKGMRLATVIPDFTKDMVLDFAKSTHGS